MNLICMCFSRSIIGIEVLLRVGAIPWSENPNLHASEGFFFSDGCRGLLLALAALGATAPTGYGSVNFSTVASVQLRTDALDCNEAAEEEWSYRRDHGSPSSREVDAHYD